MDGTGAGGVIERNRTGVGERAVLGVPALHHGPGAVRQGNGGAPGSAHAYSDWQQWFDGVDMSGSGKVDAESLRDSGAQSLEELVQAWGGLSRYDQATGSWQYVLPQFSENYGEMIKLLAPLRSVAPYCDANSDSFLLVYSYIWGNGDNAYLTLDKQRSRFAAAPTPAQRKEADAALETLMDSGAD